MKKKSIISKTAALFLSFCMVFSLALMIPAATLADGETDPGETGANDEAAPGSANVDRSYKYAFVISSEDDQVTVPGVYSQENGLYVEARNGKKADITVEGEIQADQQGLKAVANEPGSTVTVTVETRIVSGTDDAVLITANKGKVTVEADSVTARHESDGIDITAEMQAEVDVTVGSVSGDKDGITVSSQSGSLVKVNPQNQVTAGEDGVVLKADGVGSAAVIEGTEGTAPIVSAGNKGVEIEAMNGAQAGGIVGDVVSSKKDAFGVWITADDNNISEAASGIIPYENKLGITAPAAASIPDDISQVSINPDAEDGAAWYSVPKGAGDSGDALTVVALYTGDVDSWAGIHVEAADGATAGIDTGKITAKDNGAFPQGGKIEDMYANCFVASNGGVVTGTLDSVESGVCGLNVYVEDGGIATVNTGGIQAGEIGVRVINEGGKTWTDVGNITSTMEGVYMDLTGKDAVSYAFVDGNLNSTGGNGIEITSYGGSAFVAVAGDAASTAESSDDVKRAGLLYHGEGDAQVLVIGTLSGDNGVRITSDTKAEDLDLTVWAIQANGGEIILGDDVDGTFAKSVNYIVMLEQPFAGGTIAAVKDDGSPLDKKYGDSDGTGFEVAHQDQKVLLSVDLEKGYTIDGVYNGMENRVALQQDEAGAYYLMVPLGGGVYFTVELSLIPEIQPQPEPQPVGPITPDAPDSVVSNSTPKKVILVVKGTVNGKTITLIASDVVSSFSIDKMPEAIKTQTNTFETACDSTDKILASGTVDFGGAFVDAEEDEIIVPLVGSYALGEIYTVVLSNGAVVQAKCKKIGLLEIPFPKDASGVGYVVLKGGLE